MRTSLKWPVGTALMLLLLGGPVATLFGASPWNRDAGAKMRGDHGAGSRGPAARAPMTYRAPAYRIERQSVAPELARTPSSRRSYSYEPAQQPCQSREPTAQRPKAAAQPRQAQRPAQAQRRYSYEPAPVYRQPRGRTSRSREPSYLRADSKMLGRFGR